MLHPGSKYPGWQCPVSDGVIVKYRNVVWDWNGTLFEDMNACIEAMNRLLEQRNLPRISGIDEYRSKFCFPVIKYYERLGFDLKNDPFEGLARMYIANYAVEYKKAGLFDGAVEVLEQLKRAGIRQYVISAAEQNSLLEQMSPFGIGHYFEAVIGTDNHYAYSKAASAKQWCCNGRIDSAETVFIGDSVHDFETAAEVGCPCILIANGHQNTDELRRVSAAVVSNISETVGLLI